MRKWYLLLTAAILLCICMVSVSTYGERIPEPDAILIYDNGSVKSLYPGDSAFSQVYSLIRISGRPVQEMAIDPDAVSEVKSAAAVEYCYGEPQKMRERSYTKILFSLSGWTENSAILYWDEDYQSGTYECSGSAEKLTALIEKRLKVKK